MHIITSTLPKNTILQRLRAVYPDIDVRLDRITNDNDQPITIVILEGSFDALNVDALIEGPLTQSEITAETERLANIQQLKDAYSNMITRLEQIQNSGAIPFTQAGFNQVLQAVKDEALYIERVMKFLRSMIT